VVVVVAAAAAAAVLVVVVIYYFEINSSVPFEADRLTSSVTCVN
jgi:hypothetical protein